MLLESRLETNVDHDARTDDELIDALNRGDTTAFDALYARHRDWVVNLAFRFTRNRETSLDILQETFLYLVKKFPRFKLSCRLRSFLYPAVRNLSISAGRKAARTLSLDCVESLAGENTPGPTPALTVDDDLAAALEALNDHHREVLQLRFVDGFELREIANALEVPLGTIKSRLHHALAHLRNSPRTKKYFNG